MLFTELEPSDPVPDLDDLRGHAGAAQQRRDLRRLGPRLTSRSYDPRSSRGAQVRRDHGHGHDREAGRLGRARQHDARRAGRRDDWGRAIRVTGHKWFFSAPMCDAFLVLAQTPPA
jgi:putative acyl-CoA dehydrogenase